METREVPPGDADVRAFLELHNADRAARRGELVDATARPALMAVGAGGGIAGVLTYDIVGPGCEILTLHAATQWDGAGTALVEAVRAIAARAGCRTLWVLTTNDNPVASLGDKPAALAAGLRFYQRHGFRLSALRPGAVDESRRTLKPHIPPTGFYGIPLRDEIELSQPVQGAAPAGAAPASTPRTN